MKKYANIFLFFFLSLAIVSCTTEDKFNASPVGKQQIVTLTGTITTPVVNALTDQDIEFTATLPDGKTFTDTVTVEITTLRTDGGRTRGYYDIMPGQTSVTDKITAVGGLVYNTTFQLSITAINLQTVEPGIHYLINSNKVSVNTGNTRIPEAESGNVIVRFAWENMKTVNRFKCWIKLPTSANDIEAATFAENVGITHKMKLSGNSNNGNISTSEGEYFFKLQSFRQLVPSEDKNYRIIIVFPNGDVTVYNGVFENCTLGDPLKKDVLKITKVGMGDNAVYTTEQL